MAASVLEYTPMMTVQLYGILRQFEPKPEPGRPRGIRLAVKSAAEAIRALCIQLPELERFLANAHMRGLEFAVFRGKRNIGEDELQFGGPEVLRIAPILRGKKRGGAFQTIIGIVLIVVGAAINYISGGSLAWLGTPMMKAGVAVAIGGVVQMLSPQMSGLNQSAAPENLPSYAFGSARNTTASGNPVPICYGKRRWGGAIISASIYAEDKV